MPYRNAYGRYRRSTVPRSRYTNSHSRVGVRSYGGVRRGVGYRRPVGY